MKNSIKPNIWGPCGWKFLHYISLGYPENPTENDKQNYKYFFNNLYKVLPCEKCSINYQKNIYDHPINNHLNNRVSLFNWVIDIHNKVNQELNKKQFNYQQAKDLYNKINDNSYSITDYCYKLIVLIIILIFIYYMYKK